MARLIWVSHILCLCFMFSHLRVECSSPNSPHLCLPEEHFALLDFKRTATPVPMCHYHVRRTIATWNESIDCCLWEGITCNKMNGHVIGLDLSEGCIATNLNTNSSLFHLEKLQSLNLALNYDISFNNSFRFSSWKSLRYLYLPGMRLYGDSLLFEISLLPKLVSLDLSSNPFLLIDDKNFQMLVHNLTELRVLSLDTVNMSGLVPSSLLNLTSTLEQLHLSQSSLQGTFPSQVFHLPSLQFLDLSGNTNLIVNLPKSNWSSPLKKLYLGGISFSVELPHSLGNLKLLEDLRLDDCQFFGPIPISLANLTKIIDLDFLNNHLEGRIIDVFGKMHKLSTLRLAKNNFAGEIPASILNLTQLTCLDLSSNQLKGPVPAGLLSLPSLIYLDLSHNKFTGPIDHILKPSLILKEVILSQNEISGSIPSSFFDPVNLTIVDISSNNLSGTITPNLLSKLVNLEILDLSSNLLRGSLPLPPSSNRLSHFSLSGNNLTGEIPSSLCNSTSLEVLDLARNSLGGKIPECFGNFSQLLVIDLKMNNFHGRIPNSLVNSFRLRTLNLNGNQLEGILPPSLVNCSSLEVLDVGNNYLNDTFPNWLGVLPNLKVLILRSNKFHGPISKSKTAVSFSQLRIIDISHNEFDGFFPTKFFQNLKGMRDVYGNEGGSKYVSEDPFGYYKDSVTVIIKGLEVKLERILTIFTTIDFSSNQFHGGIPEELGELNSLILLNLSHNSLTGQIPSSLGKITELESLDLSSNKLEGRIPEQLTSLTFLSVLNLSHNKLWGPIPQGKQFHTFSNDSYIGNSGLCGFPLTKNCNSGKQLASSPSKFEKEDDSAALFDWKFAMMGYECGLVLGLSLGYIVFTIGKPWWLVKKVEKYQQKFLGKWNHKHKKRKNQKPSQRS